MERTTWRFGPGRHLVKTWVMFSCVPLDWSSRCRGWTV